MSNTGYYYWGEVPQAEAQSVVRLANSKGWRAAIDQLEINHPGMREYVTSYSRSDWVYSCRDFSPGQKCLDIGSGWGAITFALAEHFDQVWSMEAVKERLEFQQIRARQENRKNTHFIQGDWLKLPFADDSFDLVVVNGVLEWIGLSDMSVSPLKLQQQFLSEVYRVLKPGGCVYIGIENRLAFYLFWGGTDHSGLPFTSLVPRFLADFLVRKFRKTGGKYRADLRMSLDWPSYRTYTYTKWGYSQLLRQAGFAKINFNWALSYNSPTETGCFDGDSFKYLLNLFREHNFSVTLSSKLATFLAPIIPKIAVNLLFPIFCPSFLIFAYKGQAKESFEDRLLRQVGRGATSFIKRSGTHGTVSKVSYIFLKNSQPTHIAKFSRFAKFQKYVATEEKLLALANNLKIEEHDIDGHWIFVEPFISGKVCQTYSLSDNIQAVEWLVAFEKSHRGSIIKKGDLFKQINAMSQFLDIIFDLPKNVVKTAKLRLGEFAMELIEQKATWLAEHGDFVKTNIVIGRDGKTYVLDWEFYSPQGVPMWDLLMFLINNARVSDFEGNFTGRGRYSSILKQVWQYFSQEMDLSSQVMFLGMWYVLVRSFYKRFNDPWGRHQDTKPFIELMKKWYKIEKEAYLWINSH